MLTAIILVGGIVAVVLVALWIAEAIDRSQQPPADPTPPSTYATRPDPFADHPMHCKCYHHR